MNVTHRVHRKTFIAELRVLDNFTPNSLAAVVVISGLLLGLSVKAQTDTLANNNAPLVQANANPTTLYWPASATNCVLQSATNPLAPNWTDVTNGTFIAGVALSPSPPAVFFRLRSTNAPSGVSFTATDYAVGSGPMSVTAADVNGDGKPDLISANYQDYSLTVLTNDGRGGFVLAATLHGVAAPVSVTAADVNNDGNMDLISANLANNTLTVFTNDGSGGFVLAASLGVGQWPFSVATADVDGDGKLDLISANTGDNSLSVLNNNLFVDSDEFGPITYVSYMTTNANLITSSYAMFVNPGDINSGAAPFSADWVRDLHLISGSAPVNAGVNLGSPFNVDMDGNIRGADGGWDIGAYEYADGTNHLLPDATAPTVALTSPAAGAIVSNTVTLTASASDNTGGSGMASVSFLVDGVAVGSVTASPYTLAWSSLSVTNGSHTIQARAQDVAGNQASSATTTVTVQNPAAKGENLYVTPTGAGALNGSDWNNAFAGFAGVTWGSGTGQLGAGDTLWIAGGTYTGQLLLNGSGTAGNVINIKRARATNSECTSAAGWSAAYDAQVIINNSAGGICIYSSTQPPNGPGRFITIDGQVTDGIRCNFQNVSAARGISIDGWGSFNTTFRNIGAYGPSTNAITGYPWSYDCRCLYVGTYSGGDTTPYPADLTFDHCTFAGATAFAYYVHVANVTVQYCNIHTIENTSGNQTIHQNLIYVMSSHDCTFRYNTVHDCEAVTGMFFTDYGSSGTVSSNFWIYGNVFRDDYLAWDRFINVRNTATNTGPLYICNNTFVHGFGGVMLDAPGNPNGITVIANNLFVDIGGFRPITYDSVGTWPRSVIAADVNGDGLPDLITANSVDTTSGGHFTLTILTNDGSGGFVPSSTPDAGLMPVAVVAADVNGDGKLDLISVANAGDNLWVLTNNGDGNFTRSSTPNVGNSPYSVTAADVNGDGKPDLISANYGDSTLSVLTNDGGGGFVLAASPTVDAGPLSVTTADVNGDGTPDLISANYNAGTVTVLINNTFAVVPALHIASGGGQVATYWPASATNCLLESTTNLAAPNWVTMTNGTPIVGVILNDIGSGRFFRLKQF